MYQSKATVRCAELNSKFDSLIPENNLTDQLKEKCESLLTKNECFQAVKSMKRNKAPGLDGISIEFYPHFWPLIGELLIVVFNESFDNQILPSSKHSAVLSLSVKKDDSQNIANYRPISLTNVDYCILAFALAGRLQSVVETIVHGI